MRLVTRVLAAVALSAPLALFGAEPMLYRIELAGNQVLFARTPPVAKGNQFVFSRHPDGAVMSVRRAEVRRVVTVAPARAEIRKHRPGEVIVLGPTGGGSAGAGGSTTASPTRPGEAPGGRALFNPAREYRPEWDSTQVPGQSLAFPASPGDYREGRSFAYPPGSATQTGQGQPPTGVPTGEPPKSPQ
jgi:hypothetical protein